MIQKTLPASFWKSLRNRLKTLSIIEIFALLTVVSLAVFLVKFFGIKKETRIIKVEVIKKNWVENYDPYGYRTPFWLSDKIKIGQKELGYTGKVTAELIGLENYDRSGEEAELYLTLKVVVNHIARTNQDIFHNKPLDLGSAIQLELDNNLIAGQIIDNNVPPEGYPTRNFIVTFRNRNIEPWIIPNVSVGDKVLNRATNKTIAEIIDVKTEEPTGQQVYFDTNRYLRIDKRLDQKDLIITVKLTANQVDGKWFFAGHQSVTRGNSINLFTNKIYLYSLEIVDIKDNP